ncbi:hypothetical protein [Paraburkholderia phytofirmans]|uniref:hypothetical protein n=1 Tax=Paraburkholderia TaxID=1822464 RepID=UPI0015E8C1C0|nr:hypothetical protein [Paraburkholderia phytofirmans]
MPNAAASSRSQRAALPSPIVTFGLSIVIQNVLQQVFSADPRSVATGSFESQSITLVEAPSTPHRA